MNKLAFKKIRIIIFGLTGILTLFAFSTKTHTEDFPQEQKDRWTILQEKIWVQYRNGERLTSLEFTANKQTYMDYETDLLTYVKKIPIIFPILLIKFLTHQKSEPETGSTLSL